MRGEDNIFLNGQSAATAPWIWKIISEGTPLRRDQIVDYHGNPIVQLIYPQTTTLLHNIEKLLIWCILLH